MPDNTKTRADNLDSVVDKLNKKLSDIGQPPISKGYIKKLNELRNQLKHATIFIDQGEISNLFIETENFISTYSVIFFNRELAEFSIVDLIKNEKVKVNLQKAELSLGIGDLENAIIYIAISYIELEYTHLVFPNAYGLDVLRPDRKPRYRSTYTNRGRSLGSSVTVNDPSVRDMFDEVANDFGKVYSKIFEVEKAIIYGIDYLKFLRFKSFLPNIPVTGYSEEKGVEYLVPRANPLKVRKYTLENVKFCKEFLVEIALKMAT